MTCAFPPHLRHSLDVPRQQQIIVIAEHDKIPLSQTQALVAGPYMSPVAAQVHKLHRHLLCRLPDYGGHVAARIVDNDHFFVLIRIGRNGAQTLRQQTGTIIGWYDDGYGWIFHSANQIVPPYVPTHRLPSQIPPLWHSCEGNASFNPIFTIAASL